MLGSTPSKIVLNLLAVLPVITMCFVCHYQIHPIVSGCWAARGWCGCRPGLGRGRVGRMRSLTAASRHDATRPRCRRTRWLGSATGA